MDVLVCEVDLFCGKHTVDDRLKMSRLNTLNDALKLFLHHLFVGPCTHVDTKHSAVSHHQTERVEFWGLSQGKHRFEK